MNRDAPSGRHRNTASHRLRSSGHSLPSGTGGLMGTWSHATSDQEGFCIERGVFPQTQTANKKALGRIDRALGFSDGGKGPETSV